MTARQKRTKKTITGFAATRGRRDIIRQAAEDVQRGLQDTSRDEAVRKPARRLRRGNP